MSAEVTDEELIALLLQLDETQLKIIWQRVLYEVSKPDAARVQPEESRN